VRHAPGLFLCLRNLKPADLPRTPYMNADLEHVIALQRIDSSIHDAEHRLADEPSRLAALDSRLDGARQEVTRAKEAIAANQAARRDLEKELAVHQGRLSKFREQAMAVKTNQEYHAIQHEISFAQNEIKTHEDRMLERMMEADDLSGALKIAETNLATTQKAVEADKRAITVEHDELRARVETLKSERGAVVASLPANVLSLFDLVSKRRNGVAVAEAKDGICTICHVRLRPQVFNTVRRNEAVIQCDSCQRILYFVPPAPVASAGTQS
jgi:predicted  nucleic acid-binding Zn-ribbon protein